LGGQVYLMDKPYIGLYIPDFNTLYEVSPSTGK
jgi:hypothetical protein